MKEHYKPVRVKNNLLTKLKNTFYGVAALCCIHSATNAQTGAALNFDGVNDQVVIPHNAALNLVNLYTFEAWIYPTGTGFRTILSKGDLNGGPIAGEYAFQITGTGQLALYATGTNGWKYSTAGVVTNSVWSHVAVTNNGSSVNFYVNGSLVTTTTVATSTLNPGTNPAYIGRQGTVCNCNFMSGNLDEVRIWNVARTQCEIVSYLNCEIPTSASGLVGNYHFNQGIAAGANGTITTLNDASGNSFNGTLTSLALSGTTSNWVAPGGVVSGFSTPTSCSFGGEALDFDGVNDYVTMGNLSATQFPSLQPYTIETWIKPATGFTNCVIAGMFNGGVSASWALFLNANGSLQSYRNVGPFSLTTPSNVVQANVWSHVATTFDGVNNLSVYVNGQLVASSNGFITPQPGTTAPLIFGASLNSGAPTNFFNGKMDEFRIWSVARSQCQINTFKNCEIPTSSAGLVANYHFNTGIPSANNAGITTLFESTGNNYNGTLTNLALTGSTSNWIAPGSVATGYTTTLAPSTPSVLASGSTTLCAPNSVSLTASNNASGLIFNGTNGNVSIPHNSNQVPTAEMTIEGWIYPNSTGSVTTNMIIMKGNYGYGLALGAGGCSGGAKLNYWTSPGCGSAITSTGSVPFNAWSHVAVVVKLTPVQSLEFFINGVSAGTATTGININNGSNQALILGMQGTGCSCNYFSGKMDEIRLWSGARTQAQIIANMNTSIAASSPSLQLYLKADNASGTTITDLSSNATNATIISGVTWEVPSSAPVNASSNYIWSTTATSSVINVSTTSLNSVTITAATGCTSTASQAVTVNAQPTVSVNSGVICSGGSFTIVPNGANTYTISGGSSIVTPTSNASYNVTGTSSLGCVSSNTAVSSVTVNALPTVSVNSGAVCSGNAFTIVPSGANTYTISGGSSVVTPTSNASYNVTGTSSLGCVSSNTAVSSVTVNALPVITVPSATICAGATGTLTASGAATYTWNTGSNASSISASPVTTTTYTANGTSSAGCVGSAVTATITVGAAPSIVVNSATICAGNSATLNASGVTTYTWNTGANSASIVVTPTANTTYSVSGNLTGCGVGANNTSSVAVNALPSVNAVSTTSLLCVGQSASLTASGAASYTWSTGGNASTEVISPSVTSTYTVNGTDANGCSNVTTITQSVSACTGIVNLSGIEASLISVYPNPSNGVYTIELPSTLNVSIVDVLGKVVYNQQLKDGKHSINLTNLTNGLYILKAESNGTVKTVRLIKD